jgi:hypothetical protein
MGVYASFMSIREPTILLEHDGSQKWGEPVCRSARLSFFERLRTSGFTATSAAASRENVDVSTAFWP